MAHAMMGQETFHFTSGVISCGLRCAAEVTDGSQYFVLLMITDGVISDMAQTKESVVNVSTHHSARVVNQNLRQLLINSKAQCGRLGSSGLRESLSQTSTCLFIMYSFMPAARLH